MFGRRYCSMEASSATVAEMSDLHESEGTAKAYAQSLVAGLRIDVAECIALQKAQAVSIASHETRVAEIVAAREQFFQLAKSLCERLEAGGPLERAFRTIVETHFHSIDEKVVSIERRVASLASEADEAAEAGNAKAREVVGELLSSLAAIKTEQAELEERSSTLLAASQRLDRTYREQMSAMTDALTRIHGAAAEAESRVAGAARQAFELSTVIERKYQEIAGLPEAVGALRTQIDIQNIRVQQMTGLLSRVALVIGALLVGLLLSKAWG